MAGGREAQREEEGLEVIFLFCQCALRAVSLAWYCPQIVFVLSLKLSPQT